MNEVQYERDRERAAIPSREDMIKTLDAYGHLNYAVGNEDWIACADYNVFIVPDENPWRPT